MSTNDLNDPTGAEQAGSDPQTTAGEAATAAAAPEGQPSPPVKKTARKRAAKKTAAAPTSTGDDAPADAEADGDPAPAKKTTRKRAARKTTKKAVAPAADDAASEASTDAGDDPAVTSAPVASTDDADAPATRAPRRARAAAGAATRSGAAPSGAQDGDTATAGGTTDRPGAASAPVATTHSGADPTGTDEDDEDEAADEDGTTPGAVPGVALLFQAPDLAAPRRRRAASRPAGPPAHVEDEPAAAEDDTQDDAPSTPTRTRSARGRQAPSEAGAHGPAAADHDTGDDEHHDEDPDTADAADDQGPGEDGESRSRRRRRRGGRGRRRRADGDGSEDATDSDGDDTGTDGTGTDATGSDDADDHSDDDGDSDNGDDQGAEAGSSRRRRRRRRRGSGGDLEPSADDPPNTVVRVRQPRRAEDEVTGLRGSTRLEAKRQRRREGRESGRRKPIVTEAEFLARRESVDRVMVVREHEGRTQIAVLEDDVLVEHFVARKAQASTIGNVYLGKVQNVLPSMEAAFVDIGKGRNAVLYAGEVNWDAAGLQGQPRRIELALKSGDPVLVQVTKDPVGTKGSRLTSQISLPGRYLVYVPNGSMTGISRKLPDTERARLKAILKTVVPQEAGVIVRTAAEGASEEELGRDVARLEALWKGIEKRSKAANAPSMLHREPDLTVKVIRDVFNEDFSKLVVAGDEAWSTVSGYVDEVAPDLADRLEHWDPTRGDVFAKHRIDEQIAKALERKVWLPSGGSLVIDRTEAMTVVDVNTGKFVGAGGNLEATVTKNNLEAAEEIVRQLRLRDVGGIIVIDFIDMVLESNRDLVLRRLMECLGRDRTKHQVAEVTSLGLVQMTRKRVGQGLIEAFSEPCEHCAGRGVILHDEPIVRDHGKQGSGGGQSGSGGSGGSGKGERQQSRKEQAAAAAEEKRRAEQAAAVAKVAAATRGQHPEPAVETGTDAVTPAPSEGAAAPAGAAAKEPAATTEPAAAATRPAAATVADLAPSTATGSAPAAAEPAPRTRRARRAATAPQTEPRTAPAAPSASSAPSSATAPDVPPVQPTETSAPAATSAPEPVVPAGTAPAEPQGSAPAPRRRRRATAPTQAPAQAPVLTEDQAAGAPSDPSTEGSV